MPHLRPRHLAHLILQMKNHSPVIGVLGHRQVGKTTLLEQLTKDYFSLDNKKELIEAREDPDGYVERRSQGWVALDECQNVPDLFPALKERIRLQKGRPGQFLMSGSVRFTGNPHIRESLTGRITNLELLPLSIAEIEQIEESNAFMYLLEANSFHKEGMSRALMIEKKLHRSKERALDLFLEQGGLPGICFIRDAKVRSLRIQSSLETILDRDLRQIVRTTLPYQTVLSLVKTLARNMEFPLDILNLSRETDMSRLTAKKLVYALENVFMLRLVKLEGARTGFGYYFEDIAEANYLNENTLNSHTRLGQALWMNIRAALSYRAGYLHEFFQFYSRSGRIDFCVRTSHSILGVVCIQNEYPSRKELGVVDSFLKHYKSSKVCMVHKDAKLTVISDRIAIVPVTSLI